MVGGVWGVAKCTCPTIAHSDCLTAHWLSSSLPHDLIHDTADAPHVHAVVIDTVSEETLWCPVPTRGDVLGTRML